MDFVYDLPHTRNGHDGIWVIVDQTHQICTFLTGLEELHIGAFSQAVC